ncbi:MAG: carboxy terminal-processing peptidase, partial [Bacteroidia bacterium]
ITEKANQLKREKDLTTESLYIEDFKASRDKLEEENKKFKVLEEPVKSMQVNLLPVDVKALNGDTAKMARRTDWMDKVKKDVYVSEAAYVIRDLK